MCKKLHSEQKGKRINEDSARFAKAFERAARCHPGVSLANIVFKVIHGDGCFTFMTDLEFIANLDALNNKTFKPDSELVMAFESNKNPGTKSRSAEQNAVFAKMLKRVLKHNPEMTIGEILAEVAMGSHYCSYHNDEDLIGKMERYGS